MGKGIHFSSFLIFYISTPPQLSPAASAAISVASIDRRESLTRGLRDLISGRERGSWDHMEKGLVKA